MEKDLEKLVARDSQAILPDLEQDIWRQVALRQTSRTMASWQAAVLAMGIFGSAMTGAIVAAHVSGNDGRLLVLGQEMAPSTLLFGKSQ